MYQKFVSNFGKIGIITWSCLGCLKIFIQLNSASVMISNEFYDRIYIFNIVVSLLIGISVFVLAAFRNTTSTSHTVVQGQPSTRTWRTAISALLLAALATWSTFDDLMPSIAAFSFHYGAPKEDVSINAEVLRANRAHQRGTYLLKCTYWLDFSEPKLSPFSQYVCIDNAQYEYFQRTDLPKVVLLYGQKSKYGYELHYGKQCRLTKRAPDAGDSGAIPSIFLRLSLFPGGRRSAVHPSAGNANRWAANAVELLNVENVYLKTVYLAQ